VEYTRLGAAKAPVVRTSPGADQVSVEQTSPETAQDFVV
jgi:hypothetical protein